MADELSAAQDREQALRAWCAAADYDPDDREAPHIEAFEAGFNLGSRRRGQDAAVFSGGAPRPAPSAASIPAAFNPEEWDDREVRLIEHFARAMHALTSGDWGAAGYETQMRFKLAAAYAVAALNHEGLDLLDILPKGAQGRV